MKRREDIRVNPQRVEEIERWFVGAGMSNMSLNEKIDFLLEEALRPKPAELRVMAAMAKAYKAATGEMTRELWQLANAKMAAINQGDSTEIPPLPGSRR
jgi:hypothetical protein